MTVSVRTPVVSTPGLQLGNRIWRKQIMKKGRLRYEGQDLDITDDYLRSIVDDFRTGSSMDAVPLFYATADNEHNVSPELHRGSLVDLELADDGLYGVFRLADDAEKLVEQEPRFGVSVNVRHNHEDGNGVVHPVQLSHILATFDAKWNGMKPWQQVDEVAASNTGDRIIDFTALTLAAEGETPAQEQEEAAMPKLQDEFTDEEITRLRAMLDSSNTPEGGGEPGDDGGHGEGEQPETDESGEDELSADELADIEAIAASLLDGDGGGYGDEFAGASDGADVADTDDAGAGVEDSPELVAASNHDTDALRLANEQNAAKIEQLELANQRLQATNDARAFEQERDQLARDYGIPPKVTNRLRPLLEGAGRTVQLANSNKTEDAGRVVRDALKELAQVGFVDLSNPAATGHDADAVQAAEEKTATDRKAFLDRVESEYHG